MTMITPLAQEVQVVPRGARPGVWLYRCPLCSKSPRLALKTDHAGRFGTADLPLTAYTMLTLEAGYREMEPRLWQRLRYGRIAGMPRERDLRSYHPTAWQNWGNDNFARITPASGALAVGRPAPAGWEETPTLPPNAGFFKSGRNAQRIALELGKHIVECYNCAGRCRIVWEGE